MATEELVSSIHDIIDHLMPCFYWFFIHYVNQMILTQTLQHHRISQVHTLEH